MERVQRRLRPRRAGSGRPAAGAAALVAALALAACNSTDTRVKVGGGVSVVVGGKVD